MNEFDEIVLEYFLNNQSQLFDEDVASTPEEAEEFLEDCMAVVASYFDEVKEYFEEISDISNMSKSEILEQSEVFTLPDGRFLLVEA